MELAYVLDSLGLKVEHLKEARRKTGKFQPMYIIGGT
jgi:hypothetical protein